MLQLRPIVNRFTFGEVSPLLCARTDLDRYAAGCKTLLNYIPLLQGPIQRRGGTRFIARANNNGRPVALIDFAFSETTTYILELGDRYLRVYYQGAPVLGTNGQPYQITTPWTQADLFLDNGICALKWVQSADVMFIVCPGQPPKKLMRYGHTDWRVVNLGGWNTTDRSRPNATAIALFRERLVLAAEQTVYMSQSGAFEYFEPGLRGLAEAVITGPSSLSFNASTGVVTSTHPNSSYTISFIPEEVSFNLVSTSRLVVTPKNKDERITRIGFAVASGSAVVTVSSVAGTISGRSSAGTNQTVLSFDPTRGSISSDASMDNAYIVSSMDIPVAADDPIEINVYSERMDKIAWLCPANELLVGTSGGIFSIGESTTTDPLGPENIKVVPMLNYGSEAIQALRVGVPVVFVRRAGRKVHELIYGDSGNSENDLTVAAEHVTAGGLVAMAWQSEPFEVVWCVRTDGQLAAFTYSTSQEMTAWHRHQLGGGGAVSQVAVIPAAHGGRDELWLSVRREIGGETVYYLERMEPGHNLGGARAGCFFVDCGVTVSGSGLMEASGLDHLEGMEVAILGDGGVQKRQRVTGGVVPLQYPADIVQVGLPYESIMTTVKLDANLSDGTAQGRKKRIVKARLRLIESGGGAVGHSPEAAESRLEKLFYRRGDDHMDEAVALFSGDKLVNWPHGYEEDGILSVVQTEPLPLILAAIIPVVNVEG